MSGTLQISVALSPAREDRRCTVCLAPAPEPLMLAVSRPPERPGAEPPPRLSPMVVMCHDCFIAWATQIAAVADLVRLGRYMEIARGGNPMAMLRDHALEIKAQLERSGYRPEDDT